MPRRALLLLVPALLLAGSPAMAQELEETLAEVGQVYAEGYTEPLIHAFGANQNSGLYHTAKIPENKLTFTIGIKAMGTYLNESDQQFRRVIEDVPLADYLPAGHPNAGDTGDVVLAGPTVFGDPDTFGTGTVYVNGLPVYEAEAIEGIVDTRWVPLIAPEGTIGGYYGLRGIIRWLPEVEISDLGKVKYLGLGIQWSPNFLLAPTFPVDVMVGFFKQEVDIGSVVQTDATSLYAAASKEYGIATVYGGLAWEDSKMTVEYVEEATNTPVSFEKDGKMTSRLTLGATVDFGVKLNAEMGIGKMVVYNVGLMFGM